MLSSPFLKSLYLPLAKIDRNIYPLSLPIFQCNFENSWRLDFQTPVTFFVGENGTGKSTLLEAIAAKCGFNLQGGNKNHLYAQEVNPPDTHQLANQLRIGWLPKVNKGFFFRAESFFNFASFLDTSAREDTSSLTSYGGKSLHQQSHGESFLSLFRNKFGYLQREIYLLDEPEAALSPKYQLLFLKILAKLAQTGNFQFLIITHSPILMSLPTATLLSFSNLGIKTTTYQETEHFRITKEFLNNPQHYLATLLKKE